MRSRSAILAAVATSIVLVVPNLAVTVRAQAAGAGRVLDCEPETAVAPLASSRSVTCTVMDMAGVAVSGVDLTFMEEGPAEITSTGTTPAPDNDAPDGQEYRTDAYGRVTVVVSNPSGPWGTSTIIPVPPTTRSGVSGSLILGLISAFVRAMCPGPTRRRI